MKRGIHSEADIKARCEEVGYCWLWQGAKNAQGYPLMNKDGNVHMVGRWLFEFRNKRKIKPNHVLRMRCMEPTCVSPMCMREVSRSQLVTLQWKGGRRSRIRTPQHLNALRQQAVDAGWTKLTKEQAQEIRQLRTSGILYKDLAARFGVSTTSIGRVIRGESWAEAANGSSVFAWRGVAA